jgi:ribonuclease VapC
VSSVVLDASAVLAVARLEKGADAVLAARPDATLSAVNHAEVVSKLLRCDMPRDEIDIFLGEAFPQVVPFDREQASLAGRLHAVTRKEKLSYADCACLALATLRGLPVLTGDRKWLEVPTDAEVRVFR